MADKVLCDKSDLVNIADAVRSKLGVTDTYYVSELSSAIQNIQTGGGGSSSPNLQSKSVTYTSNGTATITPDAGYDGLSSVDVTVNVASGGGAEPAVLTITSQDYTGKYNGLFVFVNSEGHLERWDYTGSFFTFPITIETVLGGMVAFIASGLPGIPEHWNPIGCETDTYWVSICTLVTNPQASVEIRNVD